MDKQTLIDNRTEVEAKFNALRDSIADREQNIVADREELTKLQGEHRALTSLIDTPKPNSKKVSE